MSEASELQKLRKEKALQQVLSADRDVINAGDVAVLISSAVKTDATGAQIDTQSLQRALANVRLSRPYLFRSARPDHGVAQGVPPPPPKTDVELAKAIFGKNSDGMAANRLAMSYKAEYQRLKEVARANNLL
jgi:hypothetical protein